MDNQPETQPEETIIETADMPEDTAPDAPGDESSFSWKKLQSLSTWAGMLSWALLLVYVINFGFAIYYDFQQLAGAPVNWMQLLSLLPRLASLFLGFFYFILLQAVSEGINLLLDSDEKLTRLLEK